MGHKRTKSWKNGSERATAEGLGTYMDLCSLKEVQVEQEFGENNWSFNQ